MNFASNNKLKARQESIIDAYRYFTNNQSLPKEKEYWTLSAACAGEDGSVLLNSDYDHTIKSNLITPDQFHGIDNNESNYLLNKKLPGNWYHGDFTSVFQDTAKNPGFLNVDTMNTFRVFRRDFYRIIKWASQWDNVVCAFNFVKNNNFYRDAKCSLEDIVALMEEDDKLHILNKWSISDRYYEYPGIDGLTDMITIYLYK